MFDKSQEAVRTVARQYERSGPVFADATGRRWRRVRRVVAVLLLLVAALVAYAAPNLYRSPLPGSLALVSPISDAELGDAVAVLGTGPMDRLLRVRRVGSEVVGTDVRSGQRIVTFSGSEAAAALKSGFVIWRYGYPATEGRTISLTFDDGPDPVVTPQLLDVLSRHHVPATFFVVGRQVAGNPAIVERMSREGHGIGIHTLTHPDIAHQPDWLAQWELVSTQRMIRAATGHDATYWRMPYDSPDPTDQQATVNGLARADILGYRHASYDFDSLDWFVESRAGQTAADIKLPPLDGSEPHLTVLLHDGGGDRRETVRYVERLISAAQAQGYTFTSMPQVQPALADGNQPVVVTGWDRLTLALGQAMFALPRVTLAGLFWFAIVSVVLVSVTNLGLALVRRAHRSRAVWPAPDDMGPRVSVVLAAYNEEPVIARTLRSVLASDHPLLEVLVVDDGSADRTSEEVLSVAATDHRVRLLKQDNSGKSGALNNGVRQSRGDVVVTLDADTIVTPATITSLVRQFATDTSGRLGAVAGVVRVGNRRRNLLTRWQALEYITQIGIDRSAQDALGAISIVPGACAAWRREAILDAGGYSEDTLAEDCDLALMLHRRGWRVSQDDDALAYTEAPETADDLLAQRTRWTYGTLQAMWKHRGMVLRPRYGWLGMWVMPNYVLSIVVPVLFLPFMALMTFAALENGALPMLALYFGSFVAVHALVALVAVRLMREDLDNLVVVPVYRLLYEPLRAYLLYSSILLAIKGVKAGWNKLARTGSMDAHALTASQRVEPVPARAYRAEPEGTS
ncbi:biofilm PGA synthesis N-glycosyltransferase PgaC [Raineyella antarctica]|uniref:Biofilm PGA synthesis N-glycosyltransferase PgaC n=1 Tax=Raineyella antarctica TaxID=1577474 RepID=A0A1G6HCM9_9ACTN|nr:bifunctional polysaccharide deacetylase/glycosyltransferase family 2 protein [Raineyella antarctica]SDB91695.1 biofilm PGA synthesis N-glycosyltransferase PgaC [Raineyella antarctica]